MRTLRETYMGLIYMGSRKKNKISYVNWEYGDLGRGLKGRGEAGREAEKNVELNKKKEIEVHCQDNGVNRSRMMVA